MSYKSILTKYGLKKQLDCLANNKEFDLTYIAVGDGNGQEYVPDEKQETLINELWRGKISDVGLSSDGTLACIGKIPNEDGNFIVREIGFFDSENNLICIANIPPTLKTVGTDGITDILNLKISMVIINTDLKKLIITPETNLCANVNLTNLTPKGLSIIGTVFYEIQNQVLDKEDIKKLGYDYIVIKEY